jgi:hypothetical protein
MHFSQRSCHLTKAFAKSSLGMVFSSPFWSHQEPAWCLPTPFSALADFLTSPSSLCRILSIVPIDRPWLEASFRTVTRRSEATWARVMLCVCELPWFPVCVWRGRWRNGAPLAPAVLTRPGRRRGGSGKDDWHITASGLFFIFTQPRYYMYFPRYCIIPVKFGTHLVSYC